MKNRRAGERSHTIESLQKLAAVLDLEFYFGPPRTEAINPDWGGFAEAQLQIDGRPEALAQGYEPIFFHEEAGGRDTITPFAVSRAWIEDRGLDIAQLRCIAVPADQAAMNIVPGDRAVIDLRRPFDLDGRIFAYFDSLMSGVKVSRLKQLSPGVVMVITPDGEPEQLKQGPGHRILGPVVLHFSEQHLRASAGS
ncbi:MAG: hypothetical protein AAGM84_05410 [Pseudomonadota bacterium]